MNILEGKEKLKETSAKFTEQLSDAERTKEEGEEANRILESVEPEGLDSDTQETAREVVSSYSETYDSAMEEINEQVEETAETAEGHVEGLGENREQVDRNAERYSEAAGVSELGREAAETGKSKMESDSQAYSELIAENEQAVEESLEKSKNMMSIVSSLFKG